MGGTLLLLLKSRTGCASLGVVVNNLWPSICRPNLPWPEIGRRIFLAARLNLRLVCIQTWPVHGSQGSKFWPTPVGGGTSFFHPFKWMISNDYQVVHPRWQGTNPRYIWTRQVPLGYSDDGQGSHPLDLTTLGVLGRFHIREMDKSHRKMSFWWVHHVKSPLSWSKIWWTSHFCWFKTDLETPNLFYEVICDY